MKPNDEAYSNADHIPDGESYADRWAEAAQAHRATEAALGRARLNVAYGTGEREQFDVFYPKVARPEGLLVFLHGGYWRRFDRGFWSHFAAGATARGHAVAVPSYPLAPDARISEITAAAIRAIEAAAHLVSGPVRLAGHSAGGQLVAMASVRGSALSDSVRERLAHVLPISPVSDLRPLLATTMNDDLGLDDVEAAAQSPALLPGPADLATTVWVGADERPAFLDQARWLADAWPGAALRIAPGRHHFDILDDLADPDSPMTRTLFG